MSQLPHAPRGHRFPTGIIRHAIWLYYVFSLSLRDVDLLLAEREVVVSYESVRRWCLKLGQGVASGCDAGVLGRVTPGIWTRCSWPMHIGNTLETPIASRWNGRLDPKA